MSDKSVMMDLETYLYHLQLNNGWIVVKILQIYVVSALLLPTAQSLANVV